MSQNTRINSHNPFPKTSRLNPILATALKNLEVRLEEELVRYRRTRYIARPVDNNYITSDSVELKIASGGEEGDPFSLDSTLGYSEYVSAPSSDGSYADTTTSFPPGKEIFDSQSLQEESAFQSAPEKLNKKNFNKNNKKKSNRSKGGLLSPLGVFSIFLMLLTSLGFGYVLFNFRSLSKLSLSKFNPFNSNPEVSTSNTSRNTKSPPVNNQSSVGSQSLSSGTQIPSLSQSKSGNNGQLPSPSQPNSPVNQVSGTKTPPKSTNLPVSLQSTRQNTSSRSGLGVSSGNPSNPSTSSNNQFASISGGRIKRQIQQEVPRRKLQLGEGSNVAAQTVNNPYYYLITDNESDTILSAAKEIVPDAYLSPNQKYIYLGAFLTPEEAKQRLQELEARGIKARLRN
ncbi:hypothetical protein [Cylindrospermopsis raciborskii]|uniref:hypothetical protein n=1 Tax=Cylindrospermopsis raciborskii TaxID=77022 RepID=UPI000778A694|nr:hypothetical protein [Cylindrospermopsis raciborskii]MCZ2200374.1 hypothetical protein [Cylindrospermopsis raciborskii PAMP2012]MCZ2206770.1 hypothetical protein [Cylindrospermopsis raciborskii PAMP2011]